MLQSWTEISSKWDARLSSLFTTADSDANGNLEFSEFEQMMEKLRVDEPDLPSERRRLRMYQEMAQFPRVDSKTFIRVRSVAALVLTEVVLIAFAAALLCTC